MMTGYLGSSDYGMSEARSEFMNYPERIPSKNIMSIKSKIQSKFYGKSTPKLSENIMSKTIIKNNNDITVKIDDNYLSVMETIILFYRLNNKSIADGSLIESSMELPRNTC